MEITRPMQVAGGFAAIGVAVLLMLPPTKPVTAAPPTLHAFGKVQPPAPLPAVYPDYAPLPPATPVDAAADSARSATQSRAPEDSMPRDTSPSYSGGQIYAQADPDADFDRGYRWAERRGLEDPNRCMRWQDSPHVEGCLAYIRDAAGRGDAPASDDRDGDDDTG